MYIKCKNTYIFGPRVQPQELLLYISASALFQNLGRLWSPEDFCFWAFRMRDTESVMSHRVTCSQPHLLHSSAGTPVSGPDVSLPCSQSTTSPALNSPVARLWLWLLLCPSLHNCDNFALVTDCSPLGCVLLVLLLTTWCHYWGARVLVGASSTPHAPFSLSLIWFSRDGAAGRPGFVDLGPFKWGKQRLLLQASKP